jgi:hypothetical protein
LLKARPTRRTSSAPAACFSSPRVRAHLLEGLALLAALDVGQLDDVVAELGLHQAADLALLQREGRVLERLGHRAAREEVEVAALRRRARVLRVLLRDVGEAGGFFFTCASSSSAFALALSLSAAGAPLGTAIRMWLARRSSWPARRARSARSRS